MIRGSDNWTAEYDRVVSTFRKLRADAEYAWQIDQARDTAVADMKKLGFTTGEAAEVLARTGRRR